MLVKRLEAMKSGDPRLPRPSWWSELLNNQKIVAFTFLLPALAVLALVVYSSFSAMWTSFHHKMVGHRPGSFGNYRELFVEPDATT